MYIKNLTKERKLDEYDHNLNSLFIYFMLLKFSHHPTQMIQIVAFPIQGETIPQIILTFV